MLQTENGSPVVNPATLSGRIAGASSRRRIEESSRSDTIAIVAGDETL
jgi:hypothetical protein